MIPPHLPLSQNTYTPPPRAAWRLYERRKGGEWVEVVQHTRATVYVVRRVLERCQRGYEYRVDEGE